MTYVVGLLHNFSHQELSEINDSSQIDLVYKQNSYLHQICNVCFVYQDLDIEDSAIGNIALISPSFITEEDLQYKKQFNITYCYFKKTRGPPFLNT